MAAAGLGTHGPPFPSEETAGSLATGKGSGETAQYKAKIAGIPVSKAQSWKAPMPNRRQLTDWQSRASATEKECR
jgi:hypothetical protein